MSFQAFKHETVLMKSSMAEFGCNTNTRQWGEIASLYSSDMTSVYSGGLAYEYTAEPNGFGLVSVSNGAVTPNADFTRLEAAYKKTPNPTGDGGYSATTTSSQCPPAADDWEVKNDLIPAMPTAAKKFMESGAGKGPGLGNDVTTSHYGGKSYSPGLVKMDGSAASFSNTGSGTGTSSGSGSAATTSSAASGRLAVSGSSGAAFAVPVIVSLFGVLAGMRLMI